MLSCFKQVFTREAVGGYARWIVLRGFPRWMPAPMGWTWRVLGDCGMLVVLVGGLSWVNHASEICDRNLFAPFMVVLLCGWFAVIGACALRIGAGCWQRHWLMMLLLSVVLCGLWFFAPMLYVIQRVVPVSSTQNKRWAPVNTVFLIIGMVWLHLARY